MTNRDNIPYFPFYIIDYWENLLSEMDVEELRKMLEFMCEYAKTGKQPEQEGWPKHFKMAWKSISAHMERDIEKYLKKCEQNAENRKGKPKDKVLTDVNDRQRPSPTKNYSQEQITENKEQITNNCDSYGKSLFQSDAKANMTNLGLMKAWNNTFSENQIQLGLIIELSEEINHILKYYTDKEIMWVLDGLKEGQWPYLSGETKNRDKSLSFKFFVNNFDRIYDEGFVDANGIINPDYTDKETGEILQSNV